MKVTRNLIREYYGIPTGGETVFYYINAGFVKCDEENNPKVDKTAFVGDVNATCAITGYENGWKYEAQYVKGDSVVDDLADIARGQKLGSDCERVLVSVDMAAPIEGQTGVYHARRAAIAVEASPPTGDPKSITKLAGTFHQNGDLTQGTFDITQKTFAAQ